MPWVVQTNCCQNDESYKLLLNRALNQKLCKLPSNHLFLKDWGSNIFPLRFRMALHLYRNILSFLLHAFIAVHSEICIFLFREVHIAPLIRVLHVDLMRVWKQWSLFVLPFRSSVIYFLNLHLQLKCPQLSHFTSDLGFWEVWVSSFSSFQVHLFLLKVHLITVRFL